MTISIQQQLLDKAADQEALAAQVMVQPDLLPEVFEGLNAKKADVKYGCDKILRLISQQNPVLLYPYFDTFVTRLDSDNNFLKWGAIHILADLAAVDAENKFDAIFDTYFAPIPGPVLITAANVIKGAAQIGQARPDLAARIAECLLQVEQASYQTAECRNIALGQAIHTFGQLYEQLEDKERVIRFVERQQDNTRSATRKKAAAFLKKAGRTLA